MKNLFIKYQRTFITIIVGFMFSVSLFFYIGSFLVTKPQWEEPSTENLKNCTSKLCILTRDAISNNSKISTIYMVFNNNIYAQYRIILDNTIKPKYFFLVPFIASYQESASIGTLFYTNKHKLFTELLFPHGVLEITAGVLSASLYYSLIINFFVLLAKKKFKDIRIVLKQSFIQILLIIALYFVAAILEGLSVSVKLGIIRWL